MLMGHGAVIITLSKFYSMLPTVLVLWLPSLEHTELPPGDWTSTEEMQIWVCLFKYWRLHVIMFLDSVFTLKPGNAKLISILFTGCVSVTPPPTVSTPLPTSTVAPASCTEPSSPQGEHQLHFLCFTCSLCHSPATTYSACDTITAFLL